MHVIMCVGYQHMCALSFHYHDYLFVLVAHEKNTLFSTKCYMVNSTIKYVRKIDTHSTPANLLCEQTTCSRITNQTKTKSLITQLHRHHRLHASRRMGAFGRLSNLCSITTQ